MATPPSSLATRSAPSPSRSTRTHRAPPDDRRRATAAPMPLAAPVISATVLMTLLRGVRADGSRLVEHAVRAGDQGGHGGADALEPLPHGLALTEAGVDALHDHGELEVAKSHVEAQLGGVAAGDLGVVRGELRGGEEPGRDGHVPRDRDAGALVVAGVLPVRERQPEV